MTLVVTACPGKRDQLPTAALYMRMWEPVYFETSMAWEHCASETHSLNGVEAALDLPVSGVCLPEQ